MSQVRERRQQWLEKINTEVRRAGLLSRLTGEMDQDLTSLVASETVDAEQAKTQKLTDQLALLDKIIAWSADHLRFNPEYVLRMRALVDTGHPLTDGQVVAVDNIIEKWEMQLDDY